MRDIILKGLACAGTIALIFMTGYIYRGDVDENRYKAEQLTQAKENAKRIGELEYENNKRLLKIQLEREDLYDAINKIQHPDCSAMGADFDRLYNKTVRPDIIPGPGTQAPVAFSNAANIIIGNSLTCRALLSEYETCYHWSTGK